MNIAIIKRPFEEPYCGDQAEYWEYDGKIMLCMVDGLGHGKYAEQAAMAALDFIRQRHRKPILEIFEACDKALHNTRGVAMGIAVADSVAGTLTYAGIGNTRGMVVGRGTTRLLSHYGIVGAGYKMLKTKTVPLAPGDLVIMYTDGIVELIDLSGYDKTLCADLEQLAEAIIEDWRRKTDDQAVLVFRSAE